MEVDIPMIVALNMADVLIKNGDKLDVDVLEQRIGLPVVAISALKDKNTDLLMKRAVETAKKPRSATSVLTRSKLGEAIAYAEGMLKEKKSAPLFHAVKLLEKDELEIAESPAESDKLQRYLKESGGQKGVLSVDTKAEIADARYHNISENYSHVLTKSSK